jgi:hypothetical protein
MVGHHARRQPAGLLYPSGHPPFESDPELILLAAAEQAAYVKTFLDGEHSALAQQILTAISVARDCLLDPEAKGEYDDWLLQTEGDSAEEPEDWDSRIEALAELHESLEWRLIESGPALQGPPPPSNPAREEDGTSEIGETASIAEPMPGPASLADSAKAAGHEVATNKTFAEDGAEGKSELPSLKKA